jgi:hypothetical protein
MSAMRLEHDLLGDYEVPADAYWGVHTARAVDNFPISGVPIGHYRSLDSRSGDCQAGLPPRPTSLLASSTRR